MSSFSYLCFQGVEADRAACSMFRYLTPRGPGELHGRGVLRVSPLLAHGFG